MTVDVPTARWFSESLLQLHAAATEAELDLALARAKTQLAVLLAEKGPKSRGPEAIPNLQQILHQAAVDWRARLRTAMRTDNAPDGLGVLTRREREVVHRISLGDTDAEIGRALGISPKTASKHVENILRKLGVETRTAAAAVAMASPPGSV